MLKRVFNKTLLQIFMILLLIISMMFISNYFIFKNSMDVMFKQTEENNRLVVKGVIQSFEESFKELNDVIYTIGTLPYQVYDSQGHENLNMNNTYLLIKNVKQIISQDFIYDFAIFFKDSDLAITSSGTESFSSVFSKRYKNSRYAPEYWRNFAVTRHPMQIIPTSDYIDEWSSSEAYQKKLLSVVASNQMSDSGLNIAVFVDVQKLYKKVNEESMMKGASLIVLDQDKNVIISTDGDYDIEGLEAVFFNSSNETVFEKGKYKYHCIKSDYNGFVYINKVPFHYEDTITIIKINKIILFLTTITGIIISLILSMYIYSPVRKLICLVGIKEEDREGNHYKHIYNSIEKIQLENKLIKSKMDTMEEEVKRSIFFKMIDDITYYKDMNNQIDTYFKVIFYSKQFLMVSFDLDYCNNKKANVDEDRDALTQDEITKKIQNSLEQIVDTSVVVFYVENMQFIALVGVNKSIKRELLLRSINEVVEDLSCSVFSDYSILAAVSKYYSDAQSCKDAFEDIKMCFAYRNIRNTKVLIDVEKIEYSYDVYMPLDFNEKLSNYILSGNKSDSLQLINHIIEKNLENNINYIKFENIINDIFNSIINALVYLDVERDEILAIERQFSRKTDNYCHHIEIKKFLNSIIEQTTEKIRGESLSKLNKEFILQYIQIHYSENLYLDKMADIFGTTPKYFSNFFKKAFGINFVEYLNKVRMSHAKELLKGSDISVSEIGEKVGYLNSSTFASTFKKYCGITPTEFRKEYSTNSQLLK